MRLKYNITALFLLLMTFVITFKNTGLYALYEFDNDLFVTVFCENKNRPKIRCNGKCFIAKMQAESNEKEATTALNKLAFEQVFCHKTVSFQVISDPIYWFSKQKNSPFQIDNYRFLLTKNSSQPPEFS